MKDRFLEVMQRTGRAFMLPIAILPIAGILLGLGSSMTNTVTIETYGLQFLLGDGTLLHALFLIMKMVASTIFDNLPLIFAVGTAIGMARKDKEVAALSAGVAYMVMISAVSACLTVTGQILPDGQIADGVLSGTIVEIMGIQTLQMGVFGGIIVGLGVAFLNNRFRTINLPDVMAFFSGRRFIPMISILVYLFVGILMFFIWPTIQKGFYIVGIGVQNTGYFGTLVYGLVKRALIPFGLHHVFYFPFWHTAVGGSMEVAGHVVEGGQNIFFAQLADPGTTHFSVEACRYFSGEFIFMIFGLPGAALAMYRTAKPEHKKKVGGLLLTATLASVLTGITEPIEFTFLFAAPILFVVQIILAGFAYMIAHILNIAVGLTFSGGLIDLIFFGVMQGNAKTNWLRILPLGAIYFCLYYLIFKYLILRYDLKTPGREEDESKAILHGRDDMIHLQKLQYESKFPNETVRSELLTTVLGGRANILDVDCCATRLRCNLADKSLVQEEMLAYTGASGFYRMGNGIQIIYGPNVTKIKRYLERYLETPELLRKVALQEEAEGNVSPASFEGLAKTSSDEVVNHSSESVPGTSSKGVSSSIIHSPLCGEIIPLTELSDFIFSSEILGKGCAIIPEKGQVFSPVDGQVTAVFDSNHAICLKGDQGEEILIHVGINTVKLKGRGFRRIISENGVRVKRGDLILEFDMDLLGQEGYDMATPVIISNVDCYSAINLLEKKQVQVGDEILYLEK